MKKQGLKIRKTTCCLMLLMVFLLNIGGCGQPVYQYVQALDGDTVSLAISPYPQKSLAPTTYTLKITHNDQLYAGEVSVDYQMIDMSMGDLIQAVPQAKGLYLAKQTLSMSGKWQIVVKADGKKFIFNTTAN